LEQVKQTTAGLDTATIELNKKTAALAQKQDEILKQLTDLTQNGMDMANFKKMTKQTKANNRSESSGPFSQFDSDNDGKTDLPDLDLSK